MTSVSFYILEGVTDAQQRLLFACRLINKAYRGNMPVYIQTNSANDSEKFSKLLWETPENAFIPHGTSEQDHERVRINHTDDPGAHDSLLINLSDGVPDFCGRFQRIFEIVVFEPTVHVATRKNYAFYKDRGYPLSNHKIKP